MPAKTAVIKYITTSANPSCALRYFKSCPKVDLRQLKAGLIGPYSYRIRGLTNAYNKSASRLMATKLNAMKTIVPWATA